MKFHCYVRSWPNHSPQASAALLEIVEGGIAYVQALARRKWQVGCGLLSAYICVCVCVIGGREAGS